MPPALRVGSLPHAHPYVDAVLDDVDVRRVPPAAGVGGLAGQVADPADVDVLLLHFGYEGHPHAELVALLDRARQVGTPVATVVHDLDNPHLEDQRPHRAALDAILAQAAVVATLSAHAAAVLAQQWDVEALVLPHPLLVPPDRAVAARTGSRRPRVGAHLKSLRRNLLAAEAAAALAEVVRRRPEVRATVRVHVDARGRQADVDAALLAADRAGVGVLWHHRLDDDVLLDVVEDLDVLVLPYAHGTHSGLLDLALDLGTATVAPDRGAYAEQGAVATFDPAPTCRTPAAAIADAVCVALDADPPPPRDLAARARATAATRTTLLQALRRAAAGGAAERAA